MKPIEQGIRSRRTFWQVGCALAALLLIGSPILGAGDDDDPFSEKYRADHQAPAPVKRSAASAATKKLAELITFTVKVDPPEAKPGQVVKLTITGTLKPDYHTYPITQRSPDQLAGQLSSIRYTENPDLKPLGPVTESKPVFKKEGDGSVLLEHESTFTWSQDVLVSEKAQPGAKTLGITIRLMVCDKNGCIGPAPYPPLEATVRVAEGKAEKLTADIQNKLQAGPPEVKVVNPPADLARGTVGKPAPEKQSEGNEGLWGLLGAAFIGAVLMLLTPCVFPMIPITVNFFLKQSEKEHHRPLPTAMVYAGTIIAMLTLAMVVLGKVIVDWANSPVFNVGLGLALVLFALSLFGMYEIELPRGLARFTSAREGQGGYVGAVFMAMTFTITSFTCTGPFLGALLGGVAAIKPPFGHVVLAALVYSATFAAPFFLLALFPSLLKTLPKSGGWLNAIKVTMGFIELALALKFLANADQSWFPGNPRLFNYDTVLCGWIALSAAAGLYLMGFFRLPHDEPLEHIGVLRMLFAALFFGLAIYMTPLMKRVRPEGVVAEKIQAFLPPPMDNGSGASGPSTAGVGNGQNNHLPWHLDYIDAWKEAVQGGEQRLIFIDFTGVTCTNCRENESKVFPQPAVRNELAKYVRVQLYTDTVPNKQLTSAEARDQAERNSKWRDAIGDNTNPYYVIFQPDRKEPFDKNGNLNGKVLATEKGTIFDIPKFVQFLQTPQRNGTQTVMAK
jgi:thiol:disulfide interchange protein DsbD